MPGAARAPTEVLLVQFGADGLQVTQEMSVGDVTASLEEGGVVAATPGGGLGEQPSVVELRRVALT